MENFLLRAEMLLEKEKIEKIKNSRIIIFGLGGVGSFATEALARSGVGHLILVDGDNFSLTNINRQLGAVQSSIGKAKVQVVREHIKEINPECEIKIFNEFYQAGDFAKFIENEIDFVLDAIDDVPAKIDLLKNCYENKIPIISAMGTGNKLDPQKLEIADISKTDGCPLARKVRQKLRELEIFKGIDVVYSKEKLPVKNMGEGKVGSMIFVPASAGLLMASYVVKKIIGE